MYELLDQHRMIQPSCLSDFKNLKDLLDRFEVRGQTGTLVLNDQNELMLSDFRLWRRSLPT